LDLDKAADGRREHIRKAKRKVVTAFREVVERGADPEYLGLAESLMEGDHYDDDLFELPITEALAIIADDLRGEPNTFAGPNPAEEAPADTATPAYDPMRGANAIEDDPPLRASANGHDPP